MEPGDTCMVISGGKSFTYEEKIASDAASDEKWKRRRPLGGSLLSGGAIAILALWGHAVYASETKRKHALRAAQEKERSQQDFEDRARAATPKKVIRGTAQEVREEPLRPVRVRRLTEAERHTLRQVLDQRDHAPAKARRASIIMASADGVPIPEIARRLNMHRDHVREVIRAFNERGLATL